MMLDASLLNIIEGADVTDDEDIALRKSLVSMLRDGRLSCAFAEPAARRRRSTDRTENRTIH
jgi:hypothetical protein